MKEKDLENRYNYIKNLLNTTAVIKARIDQLKYKPKYKISWIDDGKKYTYKEIKKYCDARLDEDGFEYEYVVLTDNVEVLLITKDYSEIPLKQFIEDASGEEHYIDKYSIQTYIKKK